MLTVQKTNAFSERQYGNLPYGQRLTLTNRVSVVLAQVTFYWRRRRGV